jgi:nucleoid-associated protein YgaU
VSDSGREYVVKSGDTLEAIARSQMGDGQKWKSIVAANPGINPTNLKIGQKIRIPAGDAPAPKSASEAPAASSGGSSTGNTYTVQRGDTLVALSRKFYGNDGEWKRILEANKALLGNDPAKLKPGMKLAIPAKR